MLTIFKRKYFIKLKQIWFAKRYNFFDFLKIVSYQNYVGRDKLYLFIKRVSHTLQTNLEEDIEVLFKKFNSTVRNEIRRCDGDERITYKKISQVEFVQLYNIFADNYHLKRYTNAELDEYKGSITYTGAFISEVLIASHSYLLDNSTNMVRLLHSCTIEPTFEIDSKIIGRINKALHFFDLKYFKKLGFIVYDWGGISNLNNKKLQGIRKFKESFAGSHIIVINYESFLYYFLIKIQKKVL